MRLLICTQAVDQRDSVLGFFHGWILGFAKRCDTVTIICLREGKHDLPNNVEVVALYSKHRVLRALEVLWHSAVRAQRYDAVFVHMNPEYADVAGWLWRLTGKRVVLWYTHKATPFTLRFAVPFVHAVVTASKESFRLASSKVIVTGHGIDTERDIPARKPSEDGTVRLMTTGRITETKRVDVVIGAFLELKRRGMHATLKIYGEPVSARDRVYEERMRLRLKEAGEYPGVIFVGSVPHAELPNRRAEADYLLHASETGSLDKNVLDAAVSGVVPISSSEAYEDFFSGFDTLLCYPKGDSVALADRVVALEALATSERQRMVDVLRGRVVQKHSLNALLDNIILVLSGRTV